MEKMVERVMREKQRRTMAPKEIQAKLSEIEPMLQSGNDVDVVRQLQTEKRRLTKQLKERVRRVEKVIDAARNALEAATGATIHCRF
jgi:hypothetical protein